MLTNPRAAIEHLGEAIRINPSYAFARSGMGSAHILLGMPDKALPYLLEADRLSPFDIYRFHNLGEIAAAHSLMESWEAAVDAADRSLMLSPAYWYARFLKIGALGRLGRDASREIAALRHRDAEFALERARLVPFSDKSHNERLIANYLTADPAAGAV